MTPSQIDKMAEEYGKTLGLFADNRTRYDYALNGYKAGLMRGLEMAKVLEDALESVVTSDADYPTNSPGVSRLKHCVLIAKEALEQWREGGEG